MSKKIKVQVQKDHIDKLANGNPVNALSELIWNSLDADATMVQIDFNEGELGVDEIVVKDNGHGFSYNDAESLFGSLGGSWKKINSLSKNEGRFLHGKEGKGRFRAFSLGRIVEWNIYNDNSFFTIIGYADEINKFEITEPKPSKKKKSGVEVRIKELPVQFKFTNPNHALEKFAPIFSIYLNTYKNIAIQFGDMHLSTDDLISDKSEYDLLVDNEYNYKLEIIEWNSLNERSFLLCNEEGFPLHPFERQIRGIGDYNYTAYLKSEHVSILNEQNLLSLADMEPSLQPALAASIVKLKEHFRDKKIQESGHIIQRWKDENVYPYKEEPETILEDAERKVFDIVALSVNENLPEFDKSDSKTKSFQLRMLRQTIEHSPNDLQTIMTEVLQLSEEKKQELVQLLQVTSLDSIISASKLVTDRLKFISGLEELIYNPKSQKLMKERSQLHKILAKNTWIFGEMYSLSVDDQSLTEVLIKHLESINNDIIIDEPVIRIDGKKGIVDLMLTQLIPRNHPKEREHLIVELKSPKVKIGQKEINQIEAYAFAVANDERFRHLDTRWNFWIISTDLDEFAQMKRKQKGYSNGVIHTSDKLSTGCDFTIWVKTWSEIIEECKYRMDFIRKQLNYNLDKNDGLAFLKDKYAEYTQSVIEEIQEK